MRKGLYSYELMEVVTRLKEILEEIDKMFEGVKDYAYYDKIGMRREAIRAAYTLLKLSVEV